MNKRFKLPTIFWSFNFIIPLMMIVCGAPLFWWALFPNLSGDEFVSLYAHQNDQWFYSTFYLCVRAIRFVIFPGGIWMLAIYYKQDLPGYLKERASYHD